MNQPALVVETGDPYMASDVVKELLKQLRALIPSILTKAGRKKKLSIH